jgi:DNA modification methylase
VNDNIWEDRRVKIGYETAEELAGKLNPFNFRGHPDEQANALDDSLDLLGWVGGVKINIQTGRIFDGELRIKRTLVKDPALQIPVDYYDLTPDEELLALQIHDAITEQAQPIPERLAALLERTRAMTADRPGLAGMLEALKQRAGVNGKAETQDAIPQIDKAGELAKVWGTKLGQIWELGAHKIYCLDSTDEAMCKEFTKGNEYLFTDPPYGIEIDTSWLSALNMKRGKPANLSDDKLQGDDGTLDLSFLFDFDRRFIWGFPYIYDTKATGWIVWDKQPGVSERGIVTPVELASTTLRKGFDMVRLMWGGYYRAAGEERHPHPTQKPVGVFSPFIEDWTSKGDIIYDPFLGSGSTLIACENLNRRCIGFEIYPPYLAVTIQRWVDLTGKQPNLLTELV